MAPLSRLPLVEPSLPRPLPGGCPLFPGPSVATCPVSLITALHHPALLLRSAGEGLQRPGHQAAAEFEPSATQTEHSPRSLLESYSHCLISGLHNSTFASSSNIFSFQAISLCLPLSLFPLFLSSSHCASFSLLPSSFLHCSLSPSSSLYFFIP